MYKIYCIEDINDLKYVGKTKQKLSDRLTDHISDKRNNVFVSSSKLNLYNCIIYTLEECEKDLVKEKEQYWIDNIDCVNKINAIRKITKQEYDKQYFIKNQEKIRQKNRDWWEKNKDIRNAKRRKR